VPVHVIPVPRGWSADRAWHEIRLFGRLTEDVPADEDDCQWAVIVEEDE